MVMTGACIATTIILWAGLVNAVRMGDDYPLPQAIPFCHGNPPGVYDLVGCVALVAFFMGIQKIAAMPRKNTETGQSIRHSLWLVPLSLVVAEYIRRNVRPSLSWRSLLDYGRVSEPEQFSRLVVVMATCSAIAAIAYIWRRR